MQNTIIGRVVEENGVSRRKIIFDQSIKSIEPDAFQNEHVEYYPDNYIIFPGFIDIHTHCREDVSQKDNYKETFKSASLAALSGGVVCVADMPNNPIAPIDKESYEAKSKLIADMPIDIVLYAGIGPNTSCFDESVPYKVFMGPSIGSLFFSDNNDIDHVLSRYQRCSVSFHCEDPILLKQNSNQPTHEERRPAICEIEAIKFALDLIHKHSLRGKICHVSTAEGLKLIADAKKHGVNVVAEVTPHHLYFDTTMLTPERHKWLQMNPPIRSRENRLELLDLVKNGYADFLATDHAPHTITEKLAGISGVPHLDTYGPFVAYLLSIGFDPVLLFRMACVNPGKWIEQFKPCKIGRILPDYDASFTVINLDKSPSDGRPIYSQSKWSPFNLESLPGMVDAVYVKGVKLIDGNHVNVGL